MSEAIWVVAEHYGGQLRSGTPELATAARKLGGPVVAVLCASADGEAMAQQLGTQVDHVLLLQHEELRVYGPDSYVQAILPLVAERKPRALLLQHSSTGRDLGPLLAARLGSGLLTDCLDLEWQEGLIGTRSVYGRKLIVRERAASEEPHLATLQSGAFAATDTGSHGQIEQLTPKIQTEGLRSRVVDFVEAEVGEEDIAAAEVVIAGGRGLGDKEKFAIVQELADAIGGVMAASRPVVDMGWVPHDRQVGSSGRTVRPRLYIAVGISGAIQHIVGMRESDVIVAINKDAQAPIFEYAHYGIVEDLFKVVPALIEKLKQRPR